MSRGTIRTDLTLNKAQYSRALQEAGAANQRFARSAKGMSRSLRRFGRQATAIGRQMTTAITVPLALAGGAAVKFATDFDAKAQEVRATAGLTSDQIDSIKTSVMDTAVSTGQAMDDIFSATQKAVSGSLNLLESQKLVERAARASAAGFGEMERLVDVSTTAFDLFGDKAASAEEVLDQIAKGAQNTQVNVSEMAQAFSRGASTASNLGLHQNDLIATLGVVSERFGDTQRGGRAVAEMLRQLQKPSQQAEKVIDELFGSVDNLHDSMREDFIGTLQELQTRLEGTEHGLQDVITSGQSADAIQSLLADGGERVAEVFAKQAEAAGTVDQAYQDSESFSRKLSRAQNQLMVAMIPVGQVITDMIEPALDKLVGVVRRAAEWFDELSPTMQRTAVIAAGVAAAIGPILLVVGGLASAVATAIPIVAGLMGPVTLVTAAVIAMGVAFEAQTGIISNALMGANEDVAKWEKETIAALKTVDVESEKTGQAVVELRTHMTSLAAIGEWMWDVMNRDLMAGVTESARLAAGQVETAGEAMTFLNKATIKAGVPFNDVVEAFKMGGYEAEVMAQKLRNAGVETELLTDAITLLVRRSKEASEEQTRNMSTIAGVQEAISEERKKLINAETQAERNASIQQIQIWEEKVQSMRGVTDKTKELLGDQGDGFDRASESVKEYINAMREADANAEKMNEGLQGNVDAIESWQWSVNGMESPSSTASDFVRDTNTINDAVEHSATWIEEQSKRMSDAMRQMSVSVLEDFGTMVGGLMTGAEMTGGAMGAITAMFANFMNNLGRQMVQAGAAAFAFQTTLLTNPAAAIAAGTALIAAAAAVRSTMESGAGGSGSGGGGGGDLNDIPKLAEGGIATRETLAIIGEAGPEAVIPLDQLRDMQKSGEPQRVEVTGTSRISGDDVIISFERAERKKNRRS